MREVSFQQAFGRDLQEAYEWCVKYRKSKKETDLNQVRITSKLVVLGFFALQ